MTEPYNVLFLCTGNSARSIFGEVLVNHWGKGRFRGFSAGSHPRGAVNPMTLETLKRYRLPTDSLRSKSWDEFAAPDAPSLHFVFTVCDQAAKEVCPLWPGQPMSAHWGIEDPAAVEGQHDVKLRAFNKAFLELDARIKIFTSLRLDMLDRMALQRELDALGRARGGGRLGPTADRDRRRGHAAREHPPATVPASRPAQDRRARTHRYARAAAAASDARPPPSCAGPDGSFLRRARSRSSTSESTCAPGWAARAARLTAPDRSRARDTAASGVPARPRRARDRSTPSLPECPRLPPNTRARVRGADAADAR